MTPRPRNRRSQIVAAAGPLFHKLGYQQVSMAQIAADVGITAAALYRHFPGKQQVLAAVIAEYFTRLQNADTDIGVDTADPAGVDLDSGVGLRATIRRLAAVALERREAPLLWAREYGRVAVPDRVDLRTQLTKVVLAMAGGVLDSRVGLSAAGAEILAWRAVAVLTSPSYHRTELPRPRFENTLTDMTMAVLALTPPTIGADDVAAVGRPVPATIDRLSRREALLSAALRLFAERGYHGVTVDDIGAAVGIAGPSVYNHFPGKSEFLRTLLNRGGEGLQLSMSQVLAHATDPAAALADLLQTYASFAWDHSHLVTVLVSEAHNLPEDDYRQTRQGQREYLAEWYHLLRLAVPGMDDAEARVRVHASITVINHLARSKRAKLIPPLRTHVVSSALATLGLPGLPGLAQATPWISDVGAMRSSPR